MEKKKNTYIPYKQSYQPKLHQNTGTKNGFSYTPYRDNFDQRKPQKEAYNPLLNKVPIRVTYTPKKSRFKRITQTGFQFFLKTIGFFKTKSKSIFKSIHTFFDTQQNRA